MPVGPGAHTGQHVLDWSLDSDYRGCTTSELTELKWQKIKSKIYRPKESIREDWVLIPRADITGKWTNQAADKVK